MDHSLGITRWFLNRITTIRKAVVFSSLGTGPNGKAKISHRPRTLFPCNDCRTSGHQSTTTLTSKSRSTSMISMPGMCLGKYQVLALGRCQATPLCPRNIRNTKMRQRYRWISTPFLLGRRSMDCPSRAMISWATTFMRSWGVYSDLRMNNFLHITKKMAKCYGKYTARLAHIWDRDNVDNSCLVSVCAFSLKHGQLMNYLLLSTRVAVF